MVITKDVKKRHFVKQQKFQFVCRICHKSSMAADVKASICEDCLDSGSALNEKSLLIDSDYFNFDYAHFIPWHKGHCASFHGHSSKVSVMISGLPKPDGMLVDFGEMKQLVKEAISVVDHKVLVPQSALRYNKGGRAVVSFISKGRRHRLELPSNEIAILPSDSTVENISSMLANRLFKSMPSNVTRVCVQMYEGVGKACVATEGATVDSHHSDVIKLPSDIPTFLQMANFYRSVQFTDTPQECPSEVYWRKGMRKAKVSK